MTTQSPTPTHMTPGDAPALDHHTPTPADLALLPCKCGRRPVVHGSFDTGYLIAHDCEHVTAFRASDNESGPVIAAWNRRTALSASPAQPVREPVAWAETYDGGHHYNTVSLTKTRHHTVPLYAHPAPQSDEAATLRAQLAEAKAERDEAFAALQAEKDHADAARDVLAERQRQITAEGWTPEHDDEHGDSEMAEAALCYIDHAIEMERRGTSILSNRWPWQLRWWKPTTPRRDLVKAAALILAEIERLDRLAAHRKLKEEK